MQEIQLLWVLNLNELGISTCSSYKNCCRKQCYVSLNFLSKIAYVYLEPKVISFYSASAITKQKQNYIKCYFPQRNVVLVSISTSIYDKYQC
jgi:hypothetical protein